MKYSNKEYTRIRRDNFHYMKGVIVARYFYDLLSIAVPVVIAWLIGDMADYLLALDREQILAVLPYFGLAMALNSLGAPLANMLQFRCMIRQSFSYDEYLMNRFVRKPLREIQQRNIGEILERLGGDLGNFCWNTVIIVSTPAVIISFGVVLLIVLSYGGMATSFLLLLILLPGLPVLKAQLLAARKAVFRRMFSEYNERRRSLETETFLAAEFLRNYHLEAFTQRRLKKLYNNYMEKSGLKKRRFESINAAVDFWLKYGVSLLVLAAGAVMAAQGMITTGTVLTGYLALSSIEKCYTYGVRLTEEWKSAKEYMGRISVFYGNIELENGEDNFGENEEHEQWEDAGQEPEITKIRADHLTFSYGSEREAVLRDVSVTWDKGSCIQISGENGSGKSTLFHLLSGLYEPDSGEIEDQAGKRLTVHQLRAAVAFQEQNGTIFSGTVWENLFLPENKRGEAAALLLQFGFEKPIDYPTQEGGQNLSPGERKKLLLLRALLKPSQFCLLDEPLNHLDKTGQEALIRQIRSDSRGFAIITHRDFLPDGTAQVMDLSGEALAGM